MIQKVLIIDDNHSFIDTLKLTLKDFSFQFDSVYRFQESENKIEKNGVYLNRDLVGKLIDYERQLNEAEQTAQKNKKTTKTAQEEPEADSSVPQPEKPTIDGEIINEEGYFLIIVEHDTETSLKGLQFIQSLLSRGNQWNESDFILLSSRPESLEAEARKSGIQVLEKPIRGPQIKQFILQKQKETEMLAAKANEIITSFDIQKAEEPEPAPKKRASKTTTTKSRSGSKTQTGKATTSTRKKKTT